MTTNAPLFTINDLFRRVSAAANPRAVLWQDEFGQWQPISSDQIYQRVRALAQAFLGWGAQKGDRIALIGENRWEWAVTDFAALAIGAVDVPLYHTLTGEQFAEQIRDAGCRVAVVSSRKLFDKLHAVCAQAGLEQIVIMDSPAPEGAIAMAELIGAADARGAERDPQFDARAHSIAPADPATMIFTSGTTGVSKGVVLTHGNIAANQCFAPAGFSLDATDTNISFLPLSHVTARALDYVMYNYGAQIAYCSKFDWLAETMLQIRPTVLVGVPRVFEKIRQEAERRAALSPITKYLLAWAVRQGVRYAESVYAGNRPASLCWRLAEKLVYSQVRQAFGGRVRIFISGGAPLGIDTARWFASVGIPLWDGYGLTETAPLIAINNPVHHRLGSAGMPMRNLELKFAADGELLVRGPSVFSGYWNKPDATAAAFDSEGWFQTGDIGHLDDDGYLHITDRKKDLLKTSGGKNVAPQPIEAKLSVSEFVACAAMVGDRHKFLSALIAPNFSVLEAWAREQGIQAASRAELVINARVQALYDGLIREVNKTLANFQTIKRFRLVPDEWTQESGELTPSLKLKRRIVNARYAAEIAEFYADEATASGGSAS